MSKAKTYALELTSTQFLNLMKAVYLGNWMANAHRTTDTKKEYEAIENLIFSYAPLFGFASYMVHEESDGSHYYPTSYFEAETNVHDLHDDYDEETFWDELMHRLAQRDFSNSYTHAELKEMTRDERLKKLWELEEKWGEELETNGIDRFKINKSTSKV